MELEESEMSNRVTPDPEFLPKGMDGNYHQNADSMPATDISQPQQATMRNYGGKSTLFILTNSINHHQFTHASYFTPLRSYYLKLFCIFLFQKYVWVGWGILEKEKEDADNSSLVFSVPFHDCFPFFFKKKNPLQFIL